MHGVAAHRAGRLEGRVALITGGSGSIGLATARAFVAEGAQVLLADLDGERLAAAARSLGSAEAVAWEPTDVTSPEQVEHAVRACVQRFGRLDVAFANAGVFGVVAPVSDYPLEVFERVMAVNVVGSFLVAQHALRVMQPGGSLIINSSVVGLTSDRGIAAYATSKHALVGLMRTAAKEVAPRGIRVNTIHPGPTDQRLPACDRGRGGGRVRAGVRAGVRCDDPAGAPRQAGGDSRRGRVPGKRRERVHDRAHADGGRGAQHLRTCASHA